MPMGWTVEEKEEEDYKVWAIKRPLDVLDDKWCRGLAHTLTASRYITYNRACKYYAIKYILGTEHLASKGPF